MQFHLLLIKTFYLSYSIRFILILVFKLDLLRFVYLFIFSTHLNLFLLIFLLWAILKIFFTISSILIKVKFFPFLKFYWFKLCLIVRLKFIDIKMITKIYLVTILWTFPFSVFILPNSGILLFIIKINFLFFLFTFIVKSWPCGVIYV